MSFECRISQSITPKLPYMLLLWDNISGWRIVHRSKTKTGAWKSWEFLKGDGDAVVVRVIAAPSRMHCDCKTHKNRRKHFHPCIRCRRRQIACGEFRCRKDTKTARWLCGRCRWKQDQKNGYGLKRSPTKKDFERMDAYDLEIH